MREIRLFGSEGGVALTLPFLPLSRTATGPRSQRVGCNHRAAPTDALPECSRIRVIGQCEQCGHCETEHGPSIQIPKATRLHSVRSSMDPTSSFHPHRCGRGPPALVRLRVSVHWRVKVPLWRSFPPVTESNCVMATWGGEQLEVNG